MAKHVQGNLKRRQAKAWLVEIVLFLRRSYSFNAKGLYSRKRTACSLLLSSPQNSISIRWALKVLLFLCDNVQPNASFAQSHVYTLISINVGINSTRFARKGVQVEITEVIPIQLELTLYTKEPHLLLLKLSKSRKFPLERARLRRLKVVLVPIHLVAWAYDDLF